MFWSPFSSRGIASGILLLETPLHDKQTNNFLQGDNLWDGKRHLLHFASLHAGELHTLQPKEKNFWYTFNRMRSEPRGISDMVALLGIKPWSSAPLPVTSLTLLSRLTVL
jgi:hypothetical protein